MKTIMLFSTALTAGLLLSGCSKEREEAPAAPPAGIPEAQTNEVKSVVEKVAEKAKTDVDKLNEKAKAVAASITVDREDVMADLKKSIPEITQQAEKMDQAHLLAYAKEYNAAIQTTSEKLGPVAEQIKSLPMNALLGERGKELKNTLSEYKDQLSALQQRIGIYLDRLKAMGVDLSAYGL